MCICMIVMAMHVCINNVYYTGTNRRIVESLLEYKYYTLCIFMLYPHDIGLEA